MRHEAPQSRPGLLVRASEVVGLFLFGVAIAFTVVAALDWKYRGWQPAMALCTVAVVLAFAGACTRSAGGDR